MFEENIKKISNYLYEYEIFNSYTEMNYTNKINIFCYKNILFNEEKYLSKQLMYYLFQRLINLNTYNIPIESREKIKTNNKICFSSYSYDLNTKYIDTIPPGYIFLLDRDLFCFNNFNINVIKSNESEVYYINFDLYFNYLKIYYLNLDFNLIEQRLESLNKIMKNIENE